VSDETILLIEDEPAVRDLAARVLRASGYEVLEAPTASEARLLAARRGASIDLLLSDIGIPEIAGTELARELVPSCPNMRVLLMSGDSYCVTGEIVDGTPAAFLEKPFTPSVLRQRVREVLDGGTPDRIAGPVPWQSR
jgi:DNA-binding response OmpR family regulator